MSAIQEATKVNYDYRNQNGAGIWLPPNVPPGLNNLKRIDPYESTAEQLYPIGAIGFLDQRKFAYAYATTALAGWARLVVDANIHDYTENGGDTYAEAAPYLAALIDATHIDIADTNTRAKNYWAGGYLTVHHADGVMTTTIRIAASDKGEAAYTRLYLDDPLPWAVGTTFWCNAFRSPYSNITDAARNGYEAFMGLSLCYVTAGHYSWLQIAGPCWMAQTTDIPGTSASIRDCYAHIDGTCTINPHDGTLQYIGYALGSNDAGYGETYVMLRLG